MNVKANEIERVEDLSVGVFSQEYLKKSCPVIATGAMEDWPALGKWDFDWFSAEFGGLSVLAQIGERLTGSWQEMRLDTAIRRMRVDEDRVCIRQFQVFDQRPDLLEYVPNPRYCPKDRWIMPSLWLSPQGSIQPFHQDNLTPFDGVANCLAQVCGRKSVRLVSPEYDDAMDRYPSGNSNSHFSRLDGSWADLQSHAKLDEVPVWHGELRAGDILFIPCRYWHFLESHSESVSVSYWWRPSRIADLVFSIRAQRNAADLRAFIRANQKLVTVEDVEDFGGISQVSAGLQTMSLSERKIMLTMLSDEAIALLDALSHASIKT
ncbi:MAG: cupin-like domain-containing protein [Myxococcota bacterium]|nr:cupin-like domain-containing protein [Myxococcota bacterium]